MQVVYSDVSVAISKRISLCERNVNEQQTREYNIRRIQSIIYTREEKSTASSCLQIKYTLLSPLN